MRIPVITGLLIAVLAMPGLSGAQEKTMTNNMNCPNAEEMGEIRNGMRGMMDEMEGMMENMSDPAMKERMQTMHDHMAGMMSQMQGMHSSSRGMQNEHMMGGQHMMRRDDDGSNE